MKRIALLALVLAVHARAMGSEADPRPDMLGMAAEVTALQKYLVSEATFSAPANHGAIQRSLGVIGSHVDHLDAEAFKDDPALRVNLTLLRIHLADSTRAFDQGNAPFARSMLQSSLQMCIGCHTRKKTADFAWVEPDAAEIAAIDRADYFFATRQFQKGVTVYEGIVAGYPGNGAGPWNLRKSLLALAVYHVRVAEDPANGATYFRRLAGSKDLPQYLREVLRVWGEDFARWAREKPEAHAKVGDAQLLAHAKALVRHDGLSPASSLDPGLDVRRLRASALLQRVLESPGPKTPRKAEALLLLGQLSPRLSSSQLFRVGDMYLKACIAEYPKTREARSCYVALESSVTEAYTGSAGTNVPGDEQAELQRLERLAY